MSDERLTRDERRATMSFVASDGPSSALPTGPRLDAGDTLAGRYRVIRYIAGGGTGEVYQAHDTLLDDRIALKVLRCDVSHHATTLERFRREISLAHKVTHPNVCRLFEIGQDDGVAYLTMELLDGESLSARLDRAGRMSAAEALPIVRGLAAGLGAAHAAGVIHRDFKSQNVMLVGERAVITDFGLARCAKDHDATLTGAGVLVGTPAYMAPEQVEGGELTTRTDIYAFGVVLFEMVTGRLPFIGASPLATAILRIKEDAPSARSIVPELDARWDAVIARCLASRPEDRFATVEEVVAALTSPLPVLARSVSAAKRTLRGSTLAASISGAAVVIGIGVAFVSTQAGGGTKTAAPGPSAGLPAPGPVGPVGPYPRGPLPPEPPVPPTRASVRNIDVEGLSEAEIAAMNQVARDARLEMRRAAIQPEGEDTYLIVGQIFDQLDVGPGELFSGARVVPYTVGDKPEGVKLYAIEDDSWLARLGFENGDAVSSINGLPLKSPADALALEPQLRDLKEFKVGLKRRGKVKTLTYRLLR